MKLIVISILLLFMHQNAWTQSLTLSGDALLHIKSNGMSISTGTLKLKDSSHVQGVEMIRLTASDFIKLESPKARLVTSEMGTKSSLSIPVGIQSRSVLNFKNSHPSVFYTIGMEDNSDPEALPYQWRINAQSATGNIKTNIDFSWDPSVEPVDFEFKALVVEEDSEWELPLNQKVNETMISLLEFETFGAEGSIFTIKNFTRDLDEDEVPDIIEIGQATDTLDPGSYLDTDGDGVPDFVEKLEGTDPFDPNSFKDDSLDGVPDYVGYRSPAYFLDLQDVTIPWGFENYFPLFQDSVSTMLGSGRLLTLPLNWDYSNINVFARGVYPVISNLKLPRGIFNAYKLIPKVDGIVLPKPNPIDVLLSNSNFLGEEKIFIILVGAFVVNDPEDQLHTVTLLGDGYDNSYFEIKENILFWNSTEKAVGKIEFTIIIRVTDRDGNTLDKMFVISRSRPEIDKIKIDNTFTPNDDGINDTWGVPEIRFYRGARVQVFERSGKRVFYTEDPDVRWDGNFKGLELPIGTYYWVLELLETGETRKGMLNLIGK